MATNNRVLPKTFSVIPRIKQTFHELAAASHLHAIEVDPLRKGLMLVAVHHTRDVASVMGFVDVLSHSN